MCEKPLQVSTPVTSSCESFSLTGDTGPEHSVLRTIIIFERVQHEAAGDRMGTFGKRGAEYGSTG